MSNNPNESIDPRSIDQILTERQAAPYLKALKNIIEMNEADVPVVTEHAFKTIILPLLASTEPEINMEPWVDLAGNPNRPINVVDHAGKLLFQLPALMSMRATRFAVVNDASFLEIFRRTEAIRIKSPYAARQASEKMLEGRVYDPGVNYDTAVVMDGIFRRYGLPPLFEDDGPDSDTATTAEGGRKSNIRPPDAFEEF